MEIVVVNNDIVMTLTSSSWFFNSDPWVLDRDLCRINHAVIELQFRTLTKMAFFAFFGQWASTVEAALKYLFTKKANVECILVSKLVILIPL